MEVPIYNPLIGLTNPLTPLDLYSTIHRYLFRNLDNVFKHYATVSLCYVTHALLYYTKGAENHVRKTHKVLGGA